MAQQTFIKLRETVSHSTWTTSPEPDRTNLIPVKIQTNGAEQVEPRLSLKKGNPNSDTGMPVGTEQGPKDTV